MELMVKILSKFQLHSSDGLGGTVHCFLRYFHRTIIRVILKKYIFRKENEYKCQNPAYRRY